MSAGPASSQRFLRLLAWAVAAWPPAFVVASLWLSQTHRDGFVMLFDDDGLIESLQAILYVVGVGLSVAIARSLFRDGERFWAAAYGLLAVALFWVAGEEISWGQRILGVATPEWFMQHNVQREMTLHNLPGVTETIKGALYALLPVVSALSVVGWSFGRRSAQRLRLGLWLPHPVLIPTWLGMLSYRWLRRWYYSSNKFVPFEFKRLAEAGELLFAFGVVVFLVMALGSLRSRGSAGAGGTARA